VAVVDSDGFAGAARKLGISPPAVTRAINELEAHLGVSLLTRTTRAVRVTEPGVRYLADCQLILAQLAEAEEAVSNALSAPRGGLIITAPSTFGARHITPIVTEYLDRYPDVIVSCWFLDRLVDLLGEGIDVGVRIGELPDSSMTAIRVGLMPMVVCAAPSYLAHHGIPQTPDALETHVNIASGGASSISEWCFIEHGKLRTFKLRPRLMTTGGDTAVSAALSGFGLTNALLYKVTDHLRDGRLQAVLGAFAPPPLPVHIVHREGPYASKKARAFIDLAVERLRALLVSF
jgi:DNA-binding transcriptional LysR family regulator